MAINVNEVYKTALLILNKEQRGYVTPNEFNKIATQVQLQMFENYAEELNQQLRIPQADADYSDRVMNTDEKLSVFKEIDKPYYNTDHYELPGWIDPATGTSPTGNTDTFYRLGSIVYNGLNGKQVEAQRLQRFDFYNIQNSPLTASTTSFPTYLYEDNKIYISPSTINGQYDASPVYNNISVSYLRKPKNPRWGYSVGSLGQYIYDATTYGDALINTGTGTLTSSISTNPTNKDAAVTTGVNPSATSGSGTGIEVTITTTGGAGSATVTSVTVTNAGSGYASGDTITFSGASFGGGVGGDMIITLTDADFNANSTYGSTDIELHVSEQTDFIIKLLFYFGVVINDPNIIQAAVQEARSEEINEKS